MSERLLSRQGIAEMLSTSPGVAASTLARYGVQPIDLGRGKYKGARWLESAVSAALKIMHAEAQQQAPAPPMKAATPRKPASGVKMRLTDMSINDIFNLTQARAVQ